MTFLQFEPNDQTYLSLINGYVSAQKYFDVMMLWNEVKRNLSVDRPKRIKFDQNLVDAFLYAMVKGGFFDAVMQVVEKSKEMKIFVDKWRYKQAFMETHKKLKVARFMYSWRVSTIVCSHGDVMSVAMRSKCVLSWKRSWAGGYDLKGADG
ncbi:pentatricopeptide repeat-containing protein at1g69290-like protein [Trifolium pratense]|uniref:Pentatricopeptide repeat-containing protein at1g69290-like protein n=1 Tax=Trifolium pratense TaxID=57577 RepID=A0A2K3L343_TRIPR|nr:pentatricopeptide repeat-containing protein at1g69290-like protein [Trifolium pratense]